MIVWREVKCGDGHRSLWLRVLPEHIGHPLVPYCPCQRRKPPPTIVMQDASEGLANLLKTTDWAPSFSWEWRLHFLPGPTWGGCRLGPLFLLCPLCQKPESLQEARLELRYAEGRACQWCSPWIQPYLKVDPSLHLQGL